MSKAQQVNLEAYFNRIGISQSLLNEYQKGSLELLTLIYHHHAQAIPFENLAPCGVYPPLPGHANTEVGEIVSLDIDKIFQKLVLDRRGGYCFEQNGLLAVVLRALGYTLSTMSSRVIEPHSDDNQSYFDMSGLSHSLLLVEIQGLQYLCDVGYGGRGQPPSPMLLSATDSYVESATGESYELIQATKDHVLQPSNIGGKYIVPKDIYALGNQANEDSWILCYRTGKTKPMYPVYIFSSSQMSVQADYEIANWYFSTHRDSLFKKFPLVARRKGTSLWTLFGPQFCHYDKGELVETKMILPDEVCPILQSTFELFPTPSKI